MSAEDVPVIVAARRTPIGTRGRALARLRVEELAAPVLRAALADAAAKAARLVAALKQQKREKKALASVYAGLKQLNLDQP